MPESSSPRDAAASPALTAAAVVPCAGRGRRFGAEGNKVLEPLEGEVVLARTLRALCRSPAIRQIVLVGRAEEREEILGWARRCCPPEVEVRWAEGGAERRDSVLAGLEAADPAHPLLLVHDGARPHLPLAVLERVLAAAATDGAALCTLPAVDTVKRVDPEGFVEATLAREAIHLAQTPQAFRRELVLPAYRSAVARNAPTTDDVHVLELAREAPGAAPVRIRAVPGDPRNKKITHRTDLPAAPPMTSFRIGTGFDLHRMVPGRPCILGGVRFDHDRGPEGHSDGDALLHALTDALLGAAGLDDLGTLYPDTDPAHAGADSAALLTAAWTRVRAAGYALENCDLVLLAERPKLAPRRAEVRARIAALLGVDPERVNLKGKTMEKLGPIGAGEAVAAQATALLKREP